MPNLLAQETSPYLLQHKDNPVDWLPWGEAAFARAKAEDKPVFLSVGYSSCHWCHVMAHESFEDDEVASVLNRTFVSIKVDREERPDVDEAYMTAVQLQSGRGGWPMSVFLTPDGDPFFAGTYFPKEGFQNVLRQLDAMWRSQRAQIDEAAEEFRKSLEAAMERTAPKTFRTLDSHLIDEVFQTIAAEFDSVNGGFGSAPKFPPHGSLGFLLALKDNERAREIALFTLEKVVLGGIHDHVGGGFHRYSTDERWLLPHFEKMLYDNALMLENLATAERLASGEQKALFQRAIQGAIRWLESKMLTWDELFASAFDADSEGEEGKYYTWTVEEVTDVLGSRADSFLNAYNFEPSGNFDDEATRQKTGANIPQLHKAPKEYFSEELQVLLERRDVRVAPLRDDKALVGWNGLTFAGLRAAGATDLADQVLGKVVQFCKRGDPLPHLIAYGKASGRAYLEDLAGLLWGAPLGHPLTSQLLEEVEAFRDSAAGDFFATTDAHEKLFGRSKPIFDQPIPSANAILARSFIRMGRLEDARAIIEAQIGWLERAPSSMAALALAAYELLQAEGSSPSKKHEPEPELKPVEIVTAKLTSQELKTGKDGWAHGELILTIRDGFHVNTNDPPARWLKPTEVVIEGAVVKIDYPKGSDDKYEGTVSIPFRAEGLGEFELTLRCQPCSETECLEEVEKRVTGRIA